MIEQFINKNKVALSVILALLSFYILLGFVPLPLVDTGMLKGYCSEQGQDYFWTIYAKFSLHAFSINPYLVATGFVLFASVFIRSWKKKLLDEPDGVNFLDRIILVVTIAVALINALGMVMWMKGFMVQGVPLLQAGPLASFLLVGLTSITVTLSLVFGVRWVTSFGIMNGLTLLFAVDIMVLLLQELIQIRDLMQMGLFAGFSGLFLVGFMKFDRHVENKTLPPHALGILPSSVTMILMSLIDQLWAVFFKTRIPIVVDLILVVAVSFVSSWIALIIILNAKSNLKSEFRHFNPRSPYWSMVLLSSAFAIFVQSFSRIPVVESFGSFIGFAPSLVILGMLLNDVIRNVAYISVFQIQGGEYVQVCRGSVLADVRRSVVMLERNGIKAVLLDTRPFSIIGTRLPWRECVPRVPGLVIHRVLGGGALRLFVKSEDKDRSVELLKDEVASHGLELN